jgi:hypothetical protein
MKAMFIFEFGDLDETTAGKPSTVAPVAKTERCRNRRREESVRFLRQTTRDAWRLLPSPLHRSHDEASGDQKPV